MKRAALILAALAAILTAAAAPVRTATENFVTNKIAEAVAAIPAPDYSTNNAALVETIEATAPAPGNYAAVSNRAMNAVQKGEDLEMIDDGEEYGYKLGPGGGYPWDGSGWSIYESFFFPLDYINSGGSWNWDQIFPDQDDPDKYAATLVRQADLHIAKNEVYDNIDSRGYLTNETDPSVPSWAKAANPPTETDPTVPAWAKAQTKPSYTADEIAGAMTYADTTAAIREQSLGGIWDETLQVWWTPRMRNGSLTYEATTNVNLNAEN